MPSNITIKDGIKMINLNGIVATDFSMKTLYQETLKTLSAEEVIQFTNSFAKPTRFVDGKYIEGKIQYLPRGVQYKANNFTPLQSNVGKSDVSIRRNVGNLWIPTKMIMPLMDDEGTNIYQNRLDYRPDMYVQKLITGEKFINDSFGTLLSAIEYIECNRALLGYDYYDNIDGVDNVLHATGLKDLIANAYADEAIDISTLDVTDGKSHKHIIYTPNVNSTTLSSRTEALAQLKTLMKYMKQPNNVFSHVPNIMQSAKEIVMIATIDTISSIEAADIDFIKELKPLFNVSEVKAIPKTSPDLEYLENADGTSEKVNGLINLEKALGLKSGDILLIEKDTIERFMNLTIGQAENFYQNNITYSHFVNASLGTDLTPDKAYVIFSAPILVQQYGLPVVDVSKPISPSQLKDMIEQIKELALPTKEQITLANRVRKQLVKVYKMPYAEVDSKIQKQVKRLED